MSSQITKSEAHHLPDSGDIFITLGKRLILNLSKSIVSKSTFTITKYKTQYSEIELPAGENRVRYPLCCY